LAFSVDEYVWVTAYTAEFRPGGKGERVSGGRQPGSFEQTPGWREYVEIVGTARRHAVFYRVISGGTAADIAITSGIHGHEPAFTGF